MIRSWRQTYSDLGLARASCGRRDRCITIAANIAGTPRFLAMPACFPDSVVGLLRTGR